MVFWALFKRLRGTLSYDWLGLVLWRHLQTKAWVYENSKQVHQTLNDTSTRTRMTSARRLAKAMTALYRLSVIWKSDLCCILICRCIFNTITTSGHSSLEKYTSYFIWKGCVWEVSWRLNRTATYWPPLLWS